VFNPVWTPDGRSVICTWEAPELRVPGGLSVVLSGSAANALKIRVSGVRFPLWLLQLSHLERHACSNAVPHRIVAPAPQARTSC
jgi:hypothetical protein